MSVWLRSILAATGDVSADPPPWVDEPAGILATLFLVLAAVHWAADHRVVGRVFAIIPSLVFCYFLPTLLSTLGVIPLASDLYEWVKQFVLPASLVLLTLSLDLPAIGRLGPKALVMMLAGSFGVVVGGPVALAVWQHWLPDDAWRVMSYLAGSWIGGSANAVALQRVAEASDASISPIIIVDAALSNLWTGVLLFLAGRRVVVDRWLGGEHSAIEILQRRMSEYQQRLQRSPSTGDLLTILALGFAAAWVAHLAGGELVRHEPFSNWQAYLNSFAWKVLLATTIGVALSFTRLRALEGAGASRVGSLMIYLLVACIGAGADFRRLGEVGAGYYLALGVTWMIVHVIVLLGVARMIRAPFFFVAVGSQANIGGVASAPIVAGAFHPVLAPVGVLLAILGYVLGTYAGLWCMVLCRWVAGAG